MVIRSPSFLFSYELALVGVYLLMSFGALLSLAVPILHELASHGKVRSSTAAAKRSSKWNSPRLLVTKQWFLHFYIIGLLQYTLVLLVVWDGRVEVRLLSIAATSLLGIHLVRRLYECLFVHKWSQKSKMHVTGYFLGAVYYAMLPLVFVSVTEQEDSEDRMGLSDLVGCTICVFGQHEQFKHHLILAGLRSSAPSRRDEHLLPQGRWFQWVSSPHYLAEILVYCGFAVVLKFSGPSIALLVWVFTNLAVSALESHRWYRANIPGFDGLNRRALIPFVF